MPLTYHCKMIPLSGQLIILEKGHCIFCQMWITTRNFDKIGTLIMFDFNFVVENANSYTRKYIELIYLIYIPCTYNKWLKFPSNQDYNARLSVCYLLSLWPCDQKQPYMLEEIKIPAYTDLLVWSIIISLIVWRTYIF